jgi:SAM-dependent methyltransferase
MNQKPYEPIIKACEDYFERYGDCYLGVGWTKSQMQTDTRYRIMLDVIRGSPQGVSLLDFGCGLSHLYEYMLRSGVTGIAYAGLDLSEKLLLRSRTKFPHLEYYSVDILQDAGPLPQFDYVVMNGIFNLKLSLSYQEMLEYFKALIQAAFAKARVGLAFNVMSKLVDWERDDLFHLPLDEVGRFLAAAVSRHFVLRHDYGLYEYTVYVYREAQAAQ